MFWISNEIQKTFFLCIQTCQFTKLPNEISVPKQTIRENTLLYIVSWSGIHNMVCKFQTQVSKEVETLKKFLKLHSNHQTEAEAGSPGIISLLRVEQVLDLPLEILEDHQAQNLGQNHHPGTQFHLQNRPVVRLLLPVEK